MATTKKKQPVKKAPAKTVSKKVPRSKPVVQAAPEPVPVATPAPAPVAPPRKFVLVKCKRGSDKASEGQSCNSTSAYQTSPSGGHGVGFQCAMCNFSWYIATGGAYCY